MRNFIIIDKEKIDQEIFAAAVDTNPYKVKMSNADGNGIIYVMLEMKSIPYSIYTMGIEVLSEKSVDDTLRSDPLWEEVDIENGPYTNTKSLFMDGIEEHVDFGDNWNFDVNDAFSFSMWVKPQNVASQRVLFSKSTIDASVIGYILQHTNNGTIYLQARAPSQLTSHTFTGSTLTAEQWNHVVLTYTGAGNVNGFRVYVGGTVGTVPSSTSLTNSWLLGQSAFLGQRSNSFRFNGGYNEITLWNIALSGGDVMDLYNSGVPDNPTDVDFAANLVHYYKGDGNSSPVLTDFKGSVDGTMINMDNDNFIGDTP